MDIQGMITNLQIYIFRIKGVEVNISIRNPRDLILLVNANKIASRWIKNNVTEMTMV